MRPGHPAAITNGLPADSLNRSSPPRTVGALYYEIPRSLTPSIAVLRILVLTIGHQITIGKWTIHGQQEPGAAAIHVIADQLAEARGFRPAVTATTCHARLCPSLSSDEQATSAPITPIIDSE